MTFWVLTFIAEMLEVKGTLYFFDTFMEKRDGGYRNRYRMQRNVTESCRRI